VPISELAPEEHKGPKGPEDKAFLCDLCVLLRLFGTSAIGFRDFRLTEVSILNRKEKLTVFSTEIVRIVTFPTGVRQRSRPITFANSLTGC
jgi:hypothetical protein